MSRQDGVAGNVVAFAPAAERRATVSKSGEFVQIFADLTLQWAEARPVGETSKTTDVPLTKRVKALTASIRADREARQERAQARTDVVVAFMLPPAPVEDRS